jgi:hypothetical protein
MFLLRLNRPQQLICWRQMIYVTYAVSIVSPSWRMHMNAWETMIAALDSNNRTFALSHQLQNLPMSCADPHTHPVLVYINDRQLWWCTTRVQLLKHLTSEVNLVSRLAPNVRTFVHQTCSPTADEKVPEVCWLMFCWSYQRCRANVWLLVLAEAVESQESSGGKSGQHDVLKNYQPLASGCAANCQSVATCTRVLLSLSFSSNVLVNDRQLWISYCKTILSPWISEADCSPGMLTRTCTWLTMLV